MPLLMKEEIVGKKKKCDAKEVEKNCIILWKKNFEDNAFSFFSIVLDFVNFFVSLCPF